MKEHKVPVQSLIDHIKTAVDVDPWAKEMAEELLKEHETEWEHLWDAPDGTFKGRCKKCGFVHFFIEGHDTQYKFCPECGRSVKLDGRLGEG